MSHAVLTGGLALQTEESWKGFVGKEISYQGNDVEVYFKEDDFDQFLDKLDSIQTVEYVHPVMEHAWGQSVVRLQVHGGFGCPARRHGALQEVKVAV